MRGCGRAHQAFQFDGTLTPQEITRAAGLGRWHQESDDIALRITVTYPADAALPGDCYRFVLGFRWTRTRG
ncbi:hypothetical protein [Streptomyces sp. NPDC000410]|uniref:hypothetical protein n=1 Tax=Streptomyces sp. NPDC000410 TaxID=3154254 RepID=UPI003316AB2A